MENFFEHLETSTQQERQEIGEKSKNFISEHTKICKKLLQSIGKTEKAQGRDKTILKVCKGLGRFATFWTFWALIQRNYKIIFIKNITAQFNRGGTTNAEHQHAGRIAKTH